ncbi:zinc finger protein 678-like [Euwallacea fornicatus]|uniref:zinc finger protein 678-like n=1 Tax=Euwallacea fornicatus TaxID=995702 RepID=UPI00339004B0
MDVSGAIIKNELHDVHFVKIEEPEVTRLILQNVAESPQIQQQRQILTSSEIPQILQQYHTVEEDGTVKIVQLQDGLYTYIIENEDIEGDEHYIIEEYVEEYQEPQYEAVYIQAIDPISEDTEIYTISEEIEEELPLAKAPQKKELAKQKPHSSKIKLETPLKKEGADKAPMEPSEENFGEEEMDVLYECSICKKNFKTPQGVKRHISISHSQPKPKPPTSDELSFSLCPCCGEPSDSAHTLGEFDCDQCDKLFSMQKALQRHKCIEHPVNDKYGCYECKKLFTTKQDIVEHVRVHPLKSVKCEDCGREFSRFSHLERHVGQTGCMGVLKRVYECRVCGKSFSRKDNLGEHLKAHAGIVNRRKRTITCEFCMREFSALGLLQIHVRTHTGEKPYGCDICDKKFPSSGALKKHRRKHTGEKPYTCNQCGVKFAAKETLNRHWRTHTGEKPHKCQFCGKAFIQAAQLRAHIFHHTGENAFTCPHCSRSFNRKLRLTMHIKFMHEGAEPLNCPQEGCTKTFFRKEDIQRHMMTHSGEKPFKCEVCDKAFAVRSSLRVHQNIHKKEKPVACEVCNRAFIRRDCLIRHMRARHRDLLEDIVANVEKKRLQNQLLRALPDANDKDFLKDTNVWNELTLTESVKELLGLLVDEECLTEFGHPEAPVDKVLESVIRKCGHTPAEEDTFDYIGKMRENAKLLFTVVIDDKAVKELLNNKTVDEVIMYVLKMARKQANDESEEEIEVKPSIDVLEEEKSEDHQSKQ